MTDYIRDEHGHKWRVATMLQVLRWRVATMLQVLREEQERLEARIRKLEHAPAKASQPDPPWARYDVWSDKGRSWRVRPGQQGPGVRIAHAPCPAKYWTLPRWEDVVSKPDAVTECAHPESARWKHDLMQWCSTCGAARLSPMEDWVKPSA